MAYFTLVKKEKKNQAGNVNITEHYRTIIIEYRSWWRQEADTQVYNKVKK